MAGSITIEPYAYPPTVHIRRHGPSGWNSYQKYRPWLRDEFSFRCVYCLDREVWRDMRTAMHIDHFVPQALRPDLGCAYTNLLYLCPSCNALKRSSILPDPCAVALGDCLQVFRDGSIKAVNDNADGNLLIEVLALDEPPGRTRRRLIIGTILSLASTNPAMLVEWMRYPENLPDLTAASNIPPSNSKPDGVAQSYEARRRRGELGQTY